MERGAGTVNTYPMTGQPIFVGKPWRRMRRGQYVREHGKWRWRPYERRERIGEVVPDGVVYRLRGGLVMNRKTYALLGEALEQSAGALGESAVAGLEDLVQAGPATTASTPTVEELREAVADAIAAGKRIRGRGESLPFFAMGPNPWAGSRFPVYAFGGCLP